MAGRRAHRIVIVLLAAVMCGVATMRQPQPCEPAQSPTKKVLFIGIDGVRSDSLKLARAPHLHALIQRGAFADDTQILGDRYRLNRTSSAPGWSSILTGVWADKHGVHDGRFAGANFQRYPDFLSRFKQVRPAAKTAAFASWDKIEGRIIQRADLLTTIPPRRRTPAWYAEADRQVAASASLHLTAHDPDAVFVHLILPDVVGHRRGFHPRVFEYRQAIEIVDTLIGSMLRAMRSRRTIGSEDWLVIVTSDHGGQGKDHRVGHRDPEVLTVFLIFDGCAAHPGKIRSPTFIVDPAVTALTHLGVDIDPAWDLDGQAVGLAQK